MYRPVAGTSGGLLLGRALLREAACFNLYLEAGRFTRPQQDAGSDGKLVDVQAERIMA
jgi:hypothetical protein